MNPAGIVLIDREQGRRETRMIVSSRLVTPCALVLTRLHRVWLGRESHTPIVTLTKPERPGMAKNHPRSSKGVRRAGDVKAKLG